MLSIFASFLPLFINYGEIGTMKNDELHDAILVAMESSEWQIAIVANIAVAIPVVIDFVLDIMHNKFIGNTEKEKAQLPRIFLIFSLLIPNMLLLAISFPCQYVELTVCIFTTRIILLFYGLLGHLWTVGGSMFISNWLIVAHAALALGVIAITYDTINATPVSYLFWLGISMYGLAIIIILYFVINFFSMAHKRGLQNLNSSELSCFMYLSLFCAIGLYFYISTIIDRGDYNTKFCTTYTCVEGFCTLLLSALQGRLTRHEIVMKEVIIYYIISYMTHNVSFLAYVGYASQFCSFHIS